MTLPAGTRIDHYEVVALIGAGGMGEVYARAIRASDATSPSKFSPQPSPPTRTCTGGSSRKRAPPRR